MLIRYPGGKGRVAPQIAAILADHLALYGWSVEYREPFFGGGALGFHLLEHHPGLLRHAWFNDRDPAICTTWETVARRPESLVAGLRSFVPHVESFRRYKDELLGLGCIAQAGDRTGVARKKIACHQLSYSGYGTKAGGPLGGYGQAGRYRVDDRYNAERLTTEVRRIAGLLRSADLHPDVCSCLDFEQVIRFPGDALIYLDPPYYERGPELYQFAFNHADHRRLAAVLREERRPWLLSYDRHPAILDLYGGWAEIEDLPVPYSNGGARTATEVLIRGGGLRRAARERPPSASNDEGDPPPPRAGRIGSSARHGARRAPATAR